MRSLIYQIEQVQKPAVGLDEAEVRLLTYPLIQPLPDFKWEDTNPLQLRPFKPKYHLTMGKRSYFILVTLQKISLTYHDANYSNNEY